MAPWSTRKEALDYHSKGRPGKIKVVPTKPTLTQRDLSLAYTPGVAEPFREIAREPRRRLPLHGQGQPRRRRHATAPPCSASATSGALAGKPVMEGKGVLFKRFADIDVFDIEVDSRGPGRDRSASCQLHRADLRRHQPRGHPRARVLRDREDADRDARHPRLPRRPARHRDHLRRGAAQRARAHRQEDRGHHASCSPAPAPPASRARKPLHAISACPRENILLCDSKGVIYEGRTRRA